jgi:hypothetical protein
MEMKITSKDNTRTDKRGYEEARNINEVLKAWKVNSSVYSHTTGDPRNSQTD